MYTKHKTPSVVINATCNIQKVDCNNMYILTYNSNTALQSKLVILIHIYKVV